MRFDNRVKGKVAETIIKEILSDCQFRVVDFGIEKIAREVVGLNYKEFNVLGKCSEIGQLSEFPDFLVFNKSQSKVSFVEVKYCGVAPSSSTWIESEFSMAATVFGEVVGVVFAGDKASASGHSKRESLSDFVRCFSIRCNYSAPLSPEGNLASGDASFSVCLAPRSNMGFQVEWVPMTQVDQGGDLWEQMLPLPLFFADLKPKLRRFNANARLLRNICYSMKVNDFASLDIRQSA